MHRGASSPTDDSPSTWEHAPSASGRTPFFSDCSVGGGMEFAPPFVPRTSPPVSRIHPTGSMLTITGSSTSLSASQTPLPPVHTPSWEYGPSKQINPTMPPLVPGPSGVFTNGAQDTPGNSVIANGNLYMPIHNLGNSSHQFASSLPVCAVTEEQVTASSSCPVIVHGPFVPQTVYQPRAQGDRERYVSLATLQPPIIFLTEDFPECGIPVSRLLSKPSPRLVEGDKPAFTSCGPSIGIRLQWQGYAPCHKQVQTRDYSAERRMISKAKLAHVVAKSIQKFMDTMGRQAMETGSDARWRIGYPPYITVDDIILVSLHHVSQGSWQPQLRLRRIIG